jgi:catechol 2,3-dioxygenase-like lactoylglutathione lyase family enzyme
MTAGGSVPVNIAWLDHVNIRTANLAAMSRFYEDVLGLRRGSRPDFRFGGAWHYCGDRAAVHLVEMQRPPEGGSPRLEHFAFRAFGFAPFLDRLRRANVPYEISVVPGLDIRQVNIHDPDGNHIEVQFGPEEKADLAPFEGHRG